MEHDIQAGDTLQILTFEEMCEVLGLDTEYGNKHICTGMDCLDGDMTPNIFGSTVRVDSVDGRRIYVTGEGFIKKLPPECFTVRNTINITEAELFALLGVKENTK